MPCDSRCNGGIGNMNTSKINMMINTAILALLIYLAVAVNALDKKVFPDSDIMTPLTHKMTDQKFEDAIKNFLIQKLQEIE